MGLFKSKAKEPATVVEYDPQRAMSVTDVSKLQGSLRQVADRIGWADRTQPSPVVQAVLRHGVSTYGKQTAGVWVGKTCVGYLGTPNYAAVKDRIDAKDGLPASVQLRQASVGLLANVCAG